MNFYEHHLGDYVRDTAHLSMLEDGAYRRLLDAYYIKEMPIPAALRDAYRLARAQSKPERDAVQIVLGEFFEETPEGWRHKRCDVEIERFREAEPEREARRDNERERQRRARERRKGLFEELRQHGQVPAWDTPTSELLSRLSRVTAEPPVTLSVTPPVTEPVTPVTCDVTATHTHSPLPIQKRGEGDSAQPPGKPARKPPRSSKRVPVDFEVTVGLEEWVRVRAPLVDWQRETEKFRDWEFKTPRSDWPAAWRTWMRREQDEREKNGNSGLNGHAQGAFV